MKKLVLAETRCSDWRRRNPLLREVSPKPERLLIELLHDVLDRGVPSFR